MRDAWMDSDCSMRDFEQIRKDNNVPDDSACDSTLDFAFGSGSGDSSNLAADIC